MLECRHKNGFQQTIREAFRHLMASLKADAIIFKMQTEVISTMRESSIAANGGNIVNGDKLEPLKHQLPEYLTQESLKYSKFYWVQEISLHSFS